MVKEIKVIIEEHGMNYNQNEEKEINMKIKGGQNRLKHRIHDRKVRNKERTTNTVKHFFNIYI